MNNILLTEWRKQQTNCKNTQLIAWAHSHVRNNDCFFSSVDVHNQFGYQRLDDDFFGMVFQIDHDGNSRTYNCYKLTNLGLDAVENCSYNGQLQHLSCNNILFYESILSEFEIDDALDLFSFQSACLLQPALLQFAVAFLQLQYFKYLML